MNEKIKGSAVAEKTLPDTEKAEADAGMGDDDACRCKEVSRKSFPELFRVMVKDLAFWKKKNRNST